MLSAQISVLEKDLDRAENYYPYMGKCSFTFRLSIHRGHKFCKFSGRLFGFYCKIYLVS